MDLIIPGHVLILLLLDSFQVNCSEAEKNMAVVYLELIISGISAKSVWTN